MKKNILVVDDNESICFSIKKALSIINPDLKIETTNNGLDAINIAKNKKPNLILMDIMMPEIDGLQTGSKIKSDPDINEIPIIFLTGSENPEYRKIGEKIGEDFILKPFDINDLNNRIMKVIKC
jgi:CheY-like chemotaxis protein